MAFAQALNETGYFRYGGTVTPDQNNYCGLGTTNAVVKGAHFASARMGVRAHIQHLLAYGVLAVAAVQVFRPGRVLLLVAVGLCALGVMLEFAQGAMTAYRQADPADALANATGVLLGMATALMPSRDLLLRWSGRRG